MPFESCVSVCHLPNSPKALVQEVCSVVRVLSLCTFTVSLLKNCNPEILYSVILTVPIHLKNSIRLLLQFIKLTRVRYVLVLLWC